MSGARTVPYVLVDVFADRPLEGNQLAVFTDAGALREEELQLLARETKLSETTFVLPRAAAIERERGVRVRIFTVDEELEFAGHPTLGTAGVIRGTSGAGRVELDLRVGKITVELEDRDGATFGTMRQRDPDFGRIHRREDIARFAGLSVEELREDLPIQTVSTGLPFAIVPVRSLAAIQAMRFDYARSAEYGRTTDAKFFFFVTAETIDPAARVHARMVFYNGDDPATGSAGGCCAAWMVRHGLARAGERVMIEQGTECRRPSRIYASAARAGERIVDVRVGGSVVEVARGAFRLP
jgi:trans-2,3-dihydro-3-hydroxyanthranilate isomerase